MKIFFRNLLFLFFIVLIFHSAGYASDRGKSKMNNQLILH